MPKNEEDCVRHRVTLRDGSNFYFMLGDEFIMATVPFENRPENLETRLLVDDFCQSISKVMRKQRCQ